MINKKFIQQLKKDYDKSEIERRKIISASNSILYDSKRAIFALHRNDIAKAKKYLIEIEKCLIKMGKSFGFERLNLEGSYKAAAEEFVEAKMFYLMLTNKKIDKIKNISLNLDSYIGGLCDLTGELLRRATNLASKNKSKEVYKIKKLIEEILAELVEFDIIGYLRTKYDQAKNNLHKIEQINYEIKIRK